MSGRTPKVTQSPGLRQSELVRKYSRIMEVHLANANELHAIRAVRCFFQELEEQNAAAARLDPRDIPDDEPLAAMAIDIRCTNALERHGIIYVRDIRQRSLYDLLRVPQITIETGVSIMRLVGLGKAAESQAAGIMESKSRLAQKRE